MLSKLFKRKQKPEKKNYKTEENKLAFSVSQQTYSNDKNSKYHKHLEDQGYFLDEELSGDTRHKVYHNNNNKKTIIGFRGTNDYKDVKADIEAIGINDYDHPEFKKAYEIHDKVKQKYGNNILSTGHSLGGTKAIKSAERNDGESIVFNPGSGPLVNLNTNEKSKIYRHSNDQVSMYVRGNNVENVPIKKKATYGLGSNNLGLYALEQLDFHTLDGFDDEFF